MGGLAAIAGGGLEEIDPSGNVLHTPREARASCIDAILVVAETILEDADQLARPWTEESRRSAPAGSRINRSIETKRQIILSAMDKADIPLIRGALCTDACRQIPRTP